MKTLKIAAIKYKQAFGSVWLNRLNAFWDQPKFWRPRGKNPQMSRTDLLFIRDPKARFKMLELENQIHVKTTHHFFFSVLLALFI